MHERPVDPDQPPSDRIVELGRHPAPKQPIAQRGSQGTEDGVTGFIVNNEGEAAQAAAAVSRLDRARVRRVFEARFTAHRMAEDYLNIYRRLIARDQPLLEAV